MALSSVFISGHFDSVHLSELMLDSAAWVFRLNYIDPFLTPVLKIILSDFSIATQEGLNLKLMTKGSALVPVILGIILKNLQQPPCVLEKSFR